MLIRESFSNSIHTGTDLAVGLFGTYVVSRLGHFVVLLTQRSHEVRALFWTIGSFVVYFMAGAIIWHALAR